MTAPAATSSGTDGRASAAPELSPILVDGTFELFRAYYGAPSALAAGVEVGATRAFLRSMIALLRTTGCRHVGVAFDHVIESFRNQLFAGYKTGEGIEPALWAQFPLVEEAARALGLATWPMIEHEADDALATAAASLAADPRVTSVRIASPDKDLTQCVHGKHVVCWDRLRDKLLDEPGVIDKFGVPPASIPDYLALVGDDADGIPGVPGWGARSTAAVLAAYGHLERIPRQGAWSVTVRGAARLMSALAEHWDAALLYRQLATLRRDSPIACRLEDLQWRGADPSALAALCARLELDPSTLRLPVP